MLNQNSITIERVVNGFLVTIPVPMDVNENPMYAGMIAAAKAVKGKDVMEDLQQEQEKETEKLPTCQGVFVFKTFDAVLKFLEQFK